MSAKSEVSPGGNEGAVNAALDALRDQRIIRRVQEGDYTVWGESPEEISNRLGWMKSPRVMRDELDDISSLVEEVRSEGYTHALLLGMGGSSLAPEVFRHVFGVSEGYLDLSVLDSTSPEAVLAYADDLDLSRTLFIVSTKSGGTVETFSFFKFFYNRLAEEVGEEQARRNFIAITDPGSGLVDTANEYGFRKTFLNDPEIGGRYSALSHFGLVPAALIGVDLPRLLDGASQMARECATEDPAENPGARLGAVMGALALEGRDKLTLLSDATFAPLGPWVEQLIAESTGKDGRGILPVDGEPPGDPEVYGDDRLFVYTGASESAGVRDLISSGSPVVRLEASEPYDLGGEMFRWMTAVAIAGHVIGINPFDQPNVESAKEQARQMVAAYQKEGELPEPDPTVKEGEMAAYGDVGAGSVSEALSEFLAQVRSGDYVALQAYLPPSEETTSVLQEMRVRVRAEHGVATTTGYGPRFLHSTGQLHKGGRGNGLFVQFTSGHAEDADIPDEAGKPESGLSFGVLIEAQSLGDRQALLDADRRVLRVHLGDDAKENLKRLAEGV